MNQWYVTLTSQQKNQVLKKLIKIQACWRGYIVRKRFTMIKQIFLNGIEGGYFDSSIDETYLLQNPQIIKIYKEFGPFAC